MNEQEYPKVIRLTGLTHFLGKSSETLYRVDSLEDEERVRTMHANRVIDTMEIFAREFSPSRPHA